MLSEPVKQLVQEVFAECYRRDATTGKEVRKEVEEDPEGYLLSLLMTIKEELPEVSAMLHFTVERASFEPNRTKARRLLERSGSL